MTFDLDSLYRVLSLVGLIMSTVALAYSWFANRRKDVDRRFYEGSKRMDRHDLRLQALEQGLGTLPGREDLHRLELHLSGMSGDMKAMTATMEGMAESMARTEKIVGRHEDHLMGDRS
ncbi:MAG: hypothetical protein CML68_20375 [Rhodobacteraceae bacterium]|nr:hypothetical protein [Paracoccaceae bacterium]